MNNPNIFINVPRKIKIAYPNLFVNLFSIDTKSMTTNTFAKNIHLETNAKKTYLLWRVIVKCNL